MESRTDDGTTSCAAVKMSAPPSPRDSICPRSNPCPPNRGELSRHVPLVALRHHTQGVLFLRPFFRSYKVRLDGAQPCLRGLEFLPQLRDFDFEFLRRRWEMCVCAPIDCLSLCVCVHACVYECVSVCLSFCMAYLCIYVCMYVCVCLYVCVCMYVCMCVWMYGWMGG